MGDVVEAYSPPETEFQQREGHNEQIAAEKQKKQETPISYDAKQNAAQKVMKLAGNDPASLMMTTEPVFDSLLIDRVSFREVIENWRNLEDADFPETVTVEEIGLSSADKIRNVPITRVESLWFGHNMPDVLPFLNERTMAALSDAPHPTVRYVTVNDGRACMMFAKFVKNIHAFNQLIFAANLNSRKKAIVAYSNAQK
jgi:hypothetical protein